MKPWFNAHSYDPGMITIPVQVPDELAQRLLPWQDRLPEIIELGLRQLAVGEIPTRLTKTSAQVIETLAATALITLPTFKHRQRASRHPVEAGGPPASEMIIAERRNKA